MKQIRKILILLIIFLCGSISFAQNTRNTEPPLTLSKNEAGRFIFDTIVNVEGVSKKELYNRARKWLNSTLRTPSNELMVSDTSFSEIRTNMTIELTKYKGSFINFKISIFTKDNKCRVVCESFMRYYISVDMQKYEDFEKLSMIPKKPLYRDFDNNFSMLINSFRNSMSNAINNDW